MRRRTVNHEAYLEHLPRLLLEHCGEWAVFASGKLLTVVPGLEAALDAVYESDDPDGCYVGRVVAPSEYHAVVTSGFVRVVS